MTKTLVEMAAEIIQSQCSTKNMTSDEITDALKATFGALQSLQAAETQGTQTGTEAGKAEIVPAKSILKNKIICLECGEEFKMLSPKHLSSHGLTGRDYRVKYGLKLRQPLCAKSLSDRRSKAGKERGIPEKLKEAIAAKKGKAAAAKKADATPKEVTAPAAKTKKKAIAKKKKAVEKKTVEVKD